MDRIAGDIGAMPLPFLEEGPVLHLGVKPARWEDWFQIDPLFPAYQAEKQALLERDRPMVLQALPDSAPPAQAALERIAAHLTEHHADRFRRDDDVLICQETGFPVDVSPEAALHPIARAALLVQEDLVLMRPADRDADVPAREGGYLLESACVCFPTRWNLPSKLGRPIWGIHEPVPGLNPAIGDKIDLLFARMRPGRLVERANWSLLDNAALHQPTRPGVHGNAPADAPPAAPGSLVLRVERQTLTKFDDGRILFTIRIHQRTMAALAGRPGLLQALASAVAGVPPELAAYKSIGRVEAALRAVVAGSA